VSYSDGPAKAENNAWHAYRVSHKDTREVDEYSFRAGWRNAASYTFTATSRLAPVIDSFMRWIDYITEYTPLAAADDDTPSDVA
jgi:hypothetical protein